MKSLGVNLAIPLTTRLMVAVSGGPDSVALLDLLHKAGFRKITVAHVDHQIREKSGKDSAFVKKLCKQYGFSCVVKRVNIPRLAKQRKENLEAVARDERYHFFRELKKKHKAKYIVTAHQADDQVETVLFNMIRGCGLDGISGMSEIDGDLFRPLLKTTKQEILEYVKTQKLKFRTDRTNQDPAYRRNLLRLKIIPKLKKINPNFVHTMSENIRIWSRANQYIQTLAKQFLADHERRRIPLRSFLQLPDFLQENSLRLFYEQIHGTKKNLSQQHLLQLLHVIRTNISGKQKEFGPGKMLKRMRDYILVEKQ